MTILPLPPPEDATLDKFLAFLHLCRDGAASDGRAKLVSITLTVPALDPLAVLEAIFEPDQPHFYAERPAIGTAIAGAEPVWERVCEGPTRFAKAQTFVDETLAHTMAFGDVTAPMGGPHFFCAFTFEDQTQPTAPFPAGRIFVPRWQVARANDVTTAVANLAVNPDATDQQLADQAGRLWRARARFLDFKFFPGGILPSPPHTASPSQTIAEAPPPPPTHNYRNAVRAALADIAAGRYHKIVLARALDQVSRQTLHPLAAVNRLRERFPDCYAFSIGANNGVSFIGASPERLIRLDHGTLETEALAGSARRGATASEDAAIGEQLLASEKDRREHTLVLDSLVRRLTPLGLAPTHPPEPTLKKLANVQHLRTPVRATVPQGFRVLDAVAALHPTPAVGGSPREAALPRIAELEPFPRGLYAGAIGWLDSRSGGEFFVGLRSALVQGNRARVFAGAGIVAGSDPERELAETTLKARALLDALQG